MYVVAGLNTETEYYRSKYQSEYILWINENMAKHNTRGDSIKVDIPEPLIIKHIKERIHEQKIDRISNIYVTNCFIERMRILE